MDDKYGSSKGLRQQDGRSVGQKQVNAKHPAMAISLRKLFGRLSLFILIVIAYTLAGALLFIKLEECLPEVPQQNEEEEKFIEYVKTFSDLSDEERDSALNISRSFFSHANKRKCSYGEKMIIKWWEFTIVSITTIGYGNVTPKTSQGKVTLIVYAIIGIPLAVAMYAVAGEVIVNCLKSVLCFIEIKLLKKTRVENMRRKLRVLTFFMIILNMFAGSLFSVMSSNGKNSVVDSVYLTFQTFTTIGYGDITWKAHMDIGVLLLIFAVSTFGMGLIASLLSSASSTIQQTDIAASIRKISRARKMRSPRNSADNKGYENDHNCRRETLELESNGIKK